MSDETHHGYTNWDTWEAFNLLTGDESIYNQALDAVRSYDEDDLDDSGTMSMIRDDLAPLLEGFVLVDESTINTDNVDYRDVADSLIE